MDELNGREQLIRTPAEKNRVQIEASAFYLPVWDGAVSLIVAVLAGILLDVDGLLCECFVCS